jgi:hypothetical protein
MTSLELPLRVYVCAILQDHGHVGMASSVVNL